jgi:hypothetical protein
MATNGDTDNVEGLAILGMRTFTNFLRIVSKTTHCYAVSFINNEIRKGVPLQEIFAHSPGGGGYYLDVRKVSEIKYQVTFGYQAGPLAGDGGIWEVIVDRHGDIVSVVNIVDIIS